MDIKEKLEKEQKKLANLIEQKKVIDDKIKKVQREIEQCSSVIKQQRYSEVTEVLESRGLTVEEIMQAVKTGDMLSLQERLDDMARKGEEHKGEEQEKYMTE